MRTLLLCLLLSANAQAAAPQAPPVRACPPQAPPLRPDPSEKTELRLVDGVIYQVPVDTDWMETTKFPTYHRLPTPTTTQPLTPNSTPFCPDGRCTLPNR